MGKRILGLVSIELAPIASDGGIGSNWEALGLTVKDSCVFNESDPTKTEFFVEENEDPIESFVSQKGVDSISWSTNNTTGRAMYLLFGGTFTAYKTIATFGSITAGSGYTSAAYKSVPLTGGTGTGALADITVAGGLVTVVTLVYGGEGYTVSDSLSASTAYLGAGTGFAIPVATLSNGSATKSTYEPPSTQPEVEKSLKITDKKGNIFEFVRVKFAAKKNFSFQGTRLGAIDIVATVLTPTKSGVSNWKATYAN
jgi:hypothetical protein